MVLERRPYQGYETRMKLESSYGVAGSTPFVRLNGLGITFSPQVVTNPVRVPGAMVPVGVTVDDLFTQGSVSGNVDFNAMLFVLSGLFGRPTTTALGGSPAAYQHDWVWKGRKPNRPASFLIHGGYAGRARTAAGWIFNSLTIGGARPDGFDVSGDGFAKTTQAAANLGGVTNEVQTLSMTGTVSAGTFTITAFGETTAAIAYDATAAEIVTALEALDAFEAGDISGTGGPAHSADVVFTFGGYYAGEDVALMTVNSTGLTGGTYAIAETTPGADAVIDIPQVIAGAVTGDVWIDDAWADLGTTQALSALGMELAIGERMGRVTPINSSFSSDGVIDMGEQDHTMNVSLAWDAAADAEVAKLVAGTPTFVRQQWTGPEISGGNDYTLRVDASLVYSEVGEGENTQEVYTLPLSGSLNIDPVSGNVVAIRLINEIAVLNPAA